MGDRFRRFWSRHRTLFWTLHSIWALATGVAVILLARGRYGFVPWVVGFLLLTWLSTMFLGRKASEQPEAGPPDEPAPDGAATPSADVLPPVPDLRTEATSYVTRTMYQETLFFLLPFYAYSFEARSGYPIPVVVIRTLREAAPNLAGMKVSDTPFDRVEPYLLDGLDLFVGSEPLVREGMTRGAAGAVSGLATAWPDVVARLVHDADEEAHERVVQLRERLGSLPFHAALKEVLVGRGVLTSAAVRSPLRGLTDEERERVTIL